MVTYTDGLFTYTDGTFTCGMIKLGRRVKLETVSAPIKIRSNFIRLLSAPNKNDPAATLNINAEKIYP